MVANQRYLRIGMAAFGVLIAGSLCYSLGAKYQYVAGCHARLSQLQLIESQTTQNEAQLDSNEARLDAAEAQLDGIKQ